MQEAPMPGEILANAPSWPFAPQHCDQCGVSIPPFTMAYGITASAPGGNDSAVCCSDACLTAWCVAHGRSATEDC